MGDTRNVIKPHESAGADEYVIVGFATPVPLFAIPDSANFAIIDFEAGATNTPYSIIRFRQDGGTPTATDGILVGDRETRKIITRKNLTSLLFIGVNSGQTHTVRVQYFR